MKTPNSAVLLLQCPERKGVVAAVTNFLYQNNGNILQVDEHGDAELDLFMMRVEWDVAGFRVPLDRFSESFGPLGREFQMQWSVHSAGYRPRVAIMVSKSGHCLADLLYRHHIGELPCEIPVVISNHDDQRSLAEFYKIPFHRVEISPDSKDAAEQETLSILQKARTELVVLARYMQILSGRFIASYPNRIINIHHSFLPAFIGAKPYHRSFERGVKLIGATSHYVTEVLDEGPIIEQDITRISHRDSLDDMMRKGGDIERSVLSRSVRWHVENRVIVYGRKTVVFA
jgi:formyltetrahydrofolate deformylase